MDEYVLYLDESANKNYFSISGVIIKKEKIELLKQELCDIKKCIWDDSFIEQHNPVLHCVELTRIKDYRSNRKLLQKILLQYPNYAILDLKTKDEIKQIYDNVYSKFCKLMKDLECTIIGCIINKIDLSFLYGNAIPHDEDLLFDIAFKEVIENYSHFLLKNNSVGDIIYESRNGQYDLTEKSKDFKMYDTFCKIKACGKGMLFSDEKMISKTIRYLHIFSKTEDIAGLQFADFVAYNLLQCEKIVDENTKTEFMKKIIGKLYNGMYDVSSKDLRYHFGLRRIPFEYQKIFSLENDLEKLKKAYENLKTERNNLICKKQKLEQSKTKLIEENEKLKEFIDNKQ